jgi:hypothetical protein
MIPKIRLACWVTATVFLAACDMNKVAATVRVELESPTPEQTAAAAVILQNRLSELVSSFSRVTATPGYECGCRHHWQRAAGRTDPRLRLDSGRDAHVPR